MNKNETFRMFVFHSKIKIHVHVGLNEKKYDQSDVSLTMRVSHRDMPSLEGRKCLLLCGSLRGHVQPRVLKLLWNKLLYAEWVQYVSRPFRISKLFNSSPLSSFVLQLAFMRRNISIGVNARNCSFSLNCSWSLFRRFWQL